MGSVVAAQSPESSRRQLYDRAVLEHGDDFQPGFGRVDVARGEKEYGRWPWYTSREVNPAVDGSMSPANEVEVLARTLTTMIVAIYGNRLPRRWMVDARMPCTPCIGPPLVIMRSAGKRPGGRCRKSNAKRP